MASKEKRHRAVHPRRVGNATKRYTIDIPGMNTESDNATGELIHDDHHYDLTERVVGDGHLQARCDHDAFVDWACSAVLSCLVLAARLILPITG